MNKFLPVNKEDMKERGWTQCDVIFVTGDAYCDHPSFGVALLSRYLESLGYRVGIIAQPDWRRDEDFARLGSPELFFGVTAGNLDSMLALYTSGLRPRGQDKYSPGGTKGLRPKLPTIVYTQKLRHLFPQTPVVIGGLEASLRRLGYYDFWTDQVRRSILFDAKADLLVYGMAERQVAAIAARLKKGETINSLCDIRGTVFASKSYAFLKDPVVLPSFDEVKTDKHKFLEAYRLYSAQSNPATARPVVQKTDTRFCIQEPPALPLSEEEMDALYGLPFTRTYHPSYERYGGVPALKTVEASLVSHRGCAASCSFCSLSLHQGRVIQSRSIPSIVAEARSIAKDRHFKGVITDIGGPTANLYGAVCEKKGVCAREDCLWPQVCPSLRIDFARQVRMLESVRLLEGIKAVSLQSGLRYELLLLPAAREYFRLICRHHVSGQLKIAPEHIVDDLLDLMHKPRSRVYKKFLDEYGKMNKALGKKQYLAQYFITAHPGCGPGEARALAVFTKTLGYAPKQIQDFIPLPMTRSSVMYYTGMDPETRKTLYVPRGKKEREEQRDDPE